MAARAPRILFTSLAYGVRLMAFSYNCGTFYITGDSITIELRCNRKNHNHFGCWNDGTIAETFRELLTRIKKTHPERENENQGE